MLKTVLKIILMWIISTLLLFVILNALSGDAASNIAGKQGEEAVKSLRHEMGLDRPVLIRYGEWLFDLLRGDLGKTFSSEKEVAELIKVPFLSSFSLMILVFSGLIFITLPLALYSGFYNNLFSRFLGKLSVLLSALPDFVICFFILILICSKLKLLPVLSIPGPGKTVWDNPTALIVPSISVWVVISARIFRQIKVLIENFSKTSYVTEAALSGIAPFSVLFRHLLPSALSGIFQILSNVIPFVLGNTMVAETITSFPGMGNTIISAVGSREVKIVMAFSGIIIFITLVSFYTADFFSKKQKAEGVF